MSDDTQSPAIPDIEAMIEVIERLAAARATDNQMQSVEPGDLLRHVPGKRAVFAGTFNDRAAVFRMSLDPGDDLLAREWAEMQRLWPYMSTGRCRIAEPFHYSPENHIIVMEHVPGTSLLTLLRSCPPEDRPMNLTPAADWLRKSTAMSENRRPAARAYWLRRADRAITTVPAENLRQPARDILRELTRIAPMLQGYKWRTAICHGDFHPGNLIINGARLTAIDTGASAFSPIYKDMARFLVHLGRLQVPMPGGYLYGVAKDGINAFAQAFAFDERETHICLPFIIGCEALIRINNTKLSDSRLKRASRLYATLLEDLSAVGRG